MNRPTRAEVCVVACAEAWRGDGAILASPMGLIPTLGARLARLTFAPDLLLTDGEACLVDRDGQVEGWLPYAKVFTMLAAGRRHVMMGAAQIDRHGNQNISAIGDWKRPKAQLLGVRGAPGNTVNHPVSYWVPRHSPRVFTDHVDTMASAGARRHAEKAAGWGIDAVIAIGGEGGGHVGAVPTSLLVPQVAAAVDIPVIAAGGMSGTVRRRRCCARPWWTAGPTSG